MKPVTMLASEDYSVVVISLFTVAYIVICGHGVMEALPTVESPVWVCDYTLTRVCVDDICGS